MKTKLMIIAILLSVLLLTACASGSKKTVTRIDASTQTDLSGYWNDTDVRKVCEALVASCLNSPRVNAAIAAKGGKTPVVLVGRFRNDSREQIDTSIITKTMETVIFNSGKMDFVAGGDVRDELRAERLDQQYEASEATASRLANETGADFMLFGSVKSIEEREGNRTVRTYFVSAELTNIETNQRLWMDDYNEIKKEIVRSKTRF